MRTCKKCLNNKDLSMFKKHTHGHRHVCKECQYKAELANPTAYTNRLARIKRYRDSEQGQIKAKEYLKSATGKASRKAAVEKYEATDNGALNKYNNTAKRRAARLQRTPKWVDSEEIWLIKEVYKLAADRTRLHGFSWHVDHIVPLQGKLVSGLHTVNNLQVIPWLENQKKHNKVSL